MGQAVLGQTPHSPILLLGAGVGEVVECGPWDRSAEGRLIQMIGAGGARARSRSPRWWLLVGAGLAVTLLAASPARAYPPMIGQANLDGSNPDYAFVPADTLWLAANDQHVYWSDHKPESHAYGAGSSIGRANADGTGVDHNFIRQPADSVYGVAVDSGHIYWIRWSGRLGDATIARANLDGTGVRPNFITDIGGIVAAGLAVDGSHIFWAHPWYIGRANIDGTGVDPTFIDEYNRFYDQNGVAVQAGHVYWSHLSSMDDQTWIGRANKNGTGVDPTFIDPHFGSGEPNQLTSDSSHLYWQGPGVITRANPDGTGARRLVPGATTAMAVNSSHIYWARPALPAFRFHRPMRHPRRGTASLPLDVFGPGELVLTGNGLRTVTRPIEDCCEFEKLPIRATGRKRHRLERRGHVRVTADVTFTLTGGDPTTKSKSLKLIKR